MTTDTLRGVQVKNPLVLPGDIYTDDWTDYSATSTVTGWSSLTVRQIAYKKIGKLVFITFRLSGTSDSTAASLTLPYTPHSSILGEHTFPILAIDNGSLVSSPIVYFTTTTTANFYKDMLGTGWTATGNKQVRGQFFYQTT